MSLDMVADKPAETRGPDSEDGALLGDRTFRLGAMCAAAACAPEWARASIHRGQVAGQRGIEGRGGHGNHRSFSYFAVVQFAVARAIMDAGFGTSVARAFDIAATFAHVGSGPVGDTPPRLPGLPFPPGTHTIIGASTDAARVFAWKPGMRGDMLFTITSDLGASSVVILDAQRVWRNVIRRLGEDPGEVLRAAYGGQG